MDQMLSTLKKRADSFVEEIHRIEKEYGVEIPVKVTMDVKLKDVQRT